MPSRNIVVCSFYTDDEYYRSHAVRLSENLEMLGIDQELQEIAKGPGEEWPDICRRKVPFLAGVARQHPDKRVFWIDVDCLLTDLPTMVSEFSADLIGFQRGFGSPLGMGYHRRSRFWEPCFFGINTSTQARRFVDDAEALEARATIRATDDYFFEEAWRANAEHLSFQVIPSNCVAPGSVDETDHAPFFQFGASGNVPEFRDKVAQHDRAPNRRLSSATVRDAPARAGRAALSATKALESRLPAPASARVRTAADALGIRQWLSSRQDPMLRTAGSPVGSAPDRRRLIARMLTDGQAGDSAAVRALFDELGSTRAPTSEESAARDAALVWADYAAGRGEATPVRLMWWPRPFPGNFGDWLSPLVVSTLFDRPVSFVSPLTPPSEPHLVSIGSIGRFATSDSVVAGTGVSSREHPVDPGAHVVSVRGPITAAHLAAGGGPDVDSFGDPGLLVSRIHPLNRPATTNGRLVLVRHTEHLRASLDLPDDVDELSVARGAPESIRSFLSQLNEYDGVITSAMHVMIACHSYGIPCALVGFKGLESNVHGSGIKYEDYCRGADLGVVYQPEPIGRDLRRESLRPRLSDSRVSEHKLDEISEALTEAVSVLGNLERARSSRFQRR